MGNVFLFPLRVFIGPRKTLMSQLPTSTSLKHFPATKSSPGFDLYYQIAKGTEEAGGEHRDWLPSWNHGAGWGHFVGLPTWLLGSVSMLAFGGTKLTLRSDAPHPQGKRRVIIWSHGLATWGSHYSLMCTMLMSMSDKPAVVVAVNHTDGSATASEKLGGEEVLYQVVGKGNPKEKEIRAEQLKIRAKDVAAAWEAVKGMNEKGELEGTFDTPCGFVVAGHSFGGGTAVATGIDHKDCVGVIALDPWMFPAQDAGFLSRAKDSKPCLSITCDAGALSSPPYWRSNCSLLEELPEGSTKVVRFKGSDHIDVSDVALMLPNARVSRPSAETYFLEHKRYIRDFMMSIGWMEGGDDEKQGGEDDPWVQRVPPY